MKELIFIVGPTASGKSETAYHLACSLEAEIVSADAMLVYKEPAVITACPAQKFLKEIRHHFVAVIPVSETHNVFDYHTQAMALIKSLLKKNKKVIVCGGSGLYVKALCDGIIDAPAADAVLRSELNERAVKEGLGVLYRELAAVDRPAAKKIAPQDKRRIIRALEVYHLSGERISKKQEQAKGLCSEYPCRIFGLRRPRQQLYKNIDIRCQEMFEAGAVEEVRALLKLPLSDTASKIIGIKEISSFLQGTVSSDEALSLMQRNTRNFAKRQMTWFNKDKRVEWIDVDNMAPQEISKEITKRINEH